MVAWLSALGDRWDCSNCTRTGYLCSRDGHEQEIRDRLAEAKVPPTVPLIFRADSVQVCPRALVSPLAMAVADAYGYFEKGQLGTTFLNTVVWVNDAIKLFGAELSKALRFKRKQDK